MIIKNGYSSRSIPSPDLYKAVYDQRIAAKKAGDKETANTLKLVLNSTYGATLSKFNDLRDPLMARSVCISGQLYLLELACHLMKDIEGLRITELNTDGLMAEFDDIQYDEVNTIVQEWQTRTGFNLEEENVELYCAKDVNSYVGIIDGAVTKKGGYVVRGIAPAGAFNINNNAVIVADAITEYFVHGTPPEETIGKCDDVFKFQLIAKAGSKYREAYHMVDGEKKSVQKVNRVYAARDPRYGKLYKVKAETDGEAMIESLPEHCLIDNSAVDDVKHTKIDAIDKDWYIALAQKRINDFLGIQPPKNTKKKKGDTIMATKQTEPQGMNVWMKLLSARAEFLEAAVKKSGKNMQLRYTYFELDDIVPISMPIFAKWHLLPQVYFPAADSAVMQIVDCDKPEDRIIFSAPLKEIEPIISSTKGTEVTNSVQRLGAAITYMRRYLYMLALDIVEADELEARTGLTGGEPKAEAPAEQSKPKAPATPQQRQEIKVALTSTSDNADEMQLNALKSVCEKFSAAGYKDVVSTIALKTENFTKITKAECEKLIGGLTAKLETQEAAHA